jgi:hypothetical protein
MICQEQAAARRRRATHGRRRYRQSGGCDACVSVFPVQPTGSRAGHRTPDCHGPPFSGCLPALARVRRVSPGPVARCCDRTYPATCGDLPPLPARVGATDLLHRRARSLSCARLPCRTAIKQSVKVLVARLDQQAAAWRLVWAAGHDPSPRRPARRTSGPLTYEAGDARSSWRSRTTTHDPACRALIGLVVGMPGQQARFICGATNS